MKAESFLILKEHQVEQQQKKEAIACVYKFFLFSFSSRSLCWSLKKTKKVRSLLPSSLSPLSQRLFTREDARVMRKIKAETHKNNKDKWKRRGTVSHHSILSRRVLKSKCLEPSTKTHHYIQSGWDPRGSLFLSLSLPPLPFSLLSSFYYSPSHARSPPVSLDIHAVF